MIDIYAGILTVLAVTVTIATLAILKRENDKDREKLKKMEAQIVRELKERHEQTMRKEGTKMFVRQYELNERIKELETELNMTKDKLTRTEHKYTMLLNSLEATNGQK